MLGACSFAALKANNEATLEEEDDAPPDEEQQMEVVKEEEPMKSAGSRKSQDSKKKAKKTADRENVNEVSKEFPKSAKNKGKKRKMDSVKSGKQRTKNKFRKRK